MVPAISILGLTLALQGREETEDIGEPYGRRRTSQQETAIFRPIAVVITTPTATATATASAAPLHEVWRPSLQMNANIVKGMFRSK